MGVPQGRTRWWHTKRKKNAVPLAVKAVQKLKDAKLLPFTENHKDVKIIFNMLGILFGDGGVDKRLNTVAFISADIRDINFWKKDFLKNSLLLNLNSRVILLSLGNGIDFLGYITRPWSIYVRKRVIINFKKKIKDYNKLVEKGELDEDDKKQFRAIKASYFGHFKHANCFRIKKELLDNIA